MFVAHLPAGYLLTRPFTRSRAVLAAGLAGSVFPDLDVLYFYLIDGRQHSHHSYWTHLPIFWVAVTATVAVLTRLPRLKRLRIAALFFCANALGHLVLDTVAGGILWAAPTSSASFVLIHVPARYDWWVWNFLLHWSFWIEIGICGLAGMLAATADARPPTHRTRGSRALAPPPSSAGP